MKQWRVLLSLVFVVAACSYNSENPGVGTGAGGGGSVPITPTFSAINNSILRPSCVSCHSGGSAQGGVNLSSYQALINSSVVRPGDADKSDLYIQIETGRMPRGASKLSQESAKVIFDWIEAGALNN